MDAVQGIGGGLAAGEPRGLALDALERLGVRDDEAMGEVGTVDAFLSALRRVGPVDQGPADPRTLDRRVGELRDALVEAGWARVLTRMRLDADLVIDGGDLLAIAADRSIRTALGAHKRRDRLWSWSLAFRHVFGRDEPGAVAFAQAAWRRLRGVATYAQPAPRTEALRTELAEWPSSHRTDDGVLVVVSVGPRPRSLEWRVAGSGPGVLAWVHDDLALFPEGIEAERKAALLDAGDGVAEDVDLRAIHEILVERGFVVAGLGPYRWSSVALDIPVVEAKDLGTALARHPGFNPP